MENGKREPKSIRLSASTISDYISCPRKVYYRRYYPELAEKSDALILGSLVHDTLEKFSHDFLSAMDYIASQNVSPKIKEEAIKMVSNYFSVFKEFVTDNDKIEDFVRFSSGDFEFVAKIDRHNDKRIIDWKTSKKSKGNGIDTDIQSIVYAEAFKSIYGDEPEQILFINLRNKDISNAKIRTDFRDYFWNELVPYVYSGIKNEIYPATGWFQYYAPCRFCSYREVCRADVTSHNIPTS